MITTETLRSQRRHEDIEKGYSIKLCLFVASSRLCAFALKNIVSMFSDFLCDLSASVVYFCPKLVYVSGEA